MYVATIPNRSSPPAILLRESYREGRKVKTRTLANLSRWPEEKIEALRRLLRGETLVSPHDAFEIVRTLPHGHVAAVLGTLRRLGLEELLDRRPSRKRSLATAIVVARLISPASKLATARGLAPETAVTSLGEVLEVASASEDELYAAMDWSLERKDRVEEALAARHLTRGSLVLYDVTSTYFEGRTCPLAKPGHNRDGKKGKLQIVVGVLANLEGCPVAVEVFPGNTGDSKTLAPQIEKLRGRFGIERLVLVGDRGMITEARLREDFKGIEGLEWITCLRAPAIAKLLRSGAVQMSIFDEQDLAEISHPDYPGERLIVCRNPILREERARKRAALLEATERELEKIRRATQRKRNPLRGEANIGRRVGQVIGKYKVGKHFRVKITKDSLSYERREDRIAEEAALDGIYVVRTSVSSEFLTSEETVQCYKRLSRLERAFRSLKTVDLRVRPIHHRLADRVRAHVFLCVLAYYVEWHMRKLLSPILFDDEEPESAERESVVAPAERSESAHKKASEKRNAEGLPVHSFQTLLEDLATLARNEVRVRIPGSPTFIRYTTPTPLQSRAFLLLQVSPERV